MRQSLRGALTLAAVLMTGGFAWAEYPFTTLEVPLEVVGEPATPLQVEVVARSLSSPASSTRSVFDKGRAPGSIKIGVTFDQRWEISATAPGFWAAPVVWDASVSLPLQALRLYPTGTVTGRLRVPATTSLPEELELRFEAAAGTRGRPADLPTGIVRCRLGDAGDEEGAFSCEVPAGKHDLRLHGGDFSPVYRWGETVVAGKGLDLGQVDLRPGGAVLGWVELVPEEGERTGLAGIEVRLALPEAQEGGRLENVERLKSLEMSTKTDDEGQFHLIGVPAGHYELIASRPAGSPGGELAPTRIPVQVKEGLEARLREPVVLGPPVALTLVLDPATDPYGRPWSLRFAPAIGPCGLPGRATS